MFNNSVLKSLAIGLLAGTSVVAVSNGFANTNNEPVQEVQYIAEKPVVANLADLVEDVSPAVVQVISKGNVKSNVAQAMPRFRGDRNDPFEEFFRQFRGDEGPMGRDYRFQPQQPSSIGSGFIVQGDGIVITNNHVVEDAVEVLVRLNDGREISAKVLGTDPKTDLAVLKIDADEEFDVVKWGNSDHTRVGDNVFAVGSPFGLYGSVTSGIVSARGREIGSGPYDDFIQTDTPINKGNSGGPLFNEYGDVIGVNTAIYSPGGGNVGIGFAIPSEMAQDIVADLIEDGSVDRGWIGVSIQPVTDDIAESLGLERSKGALIADVVPDGPAEKAGLQAGDIILSFDGKDVGDLRDLTRIVAGTDADSVADITIWRDGKKDEIDIKVAAFEEPNAIKASLSGDRMDNGDDIPKLGLALNNQLEVVDIDPESAAAKTNVRIGDQIETVNNVPVKSLSEVKEVLSKAAADDRETVLLRLKNKQGKRFIAVPFDRA